MLETNILLLDDWISAVMLRWTRCHVDALLLRGCHKEQPDTDATDQLTRDLVFAGCPSVLLLMKYVLKSEISSKLSQIFT